MRTTLFVAGFGTRTRARDLAYEFERYGRLVRCDIPAPKTFAAKVYAFVEFEDPHDAEDAFNQMHGRRIGGHTITVQWARNAPSASWRLDGPTTTPNPPPLPPHGERVVSSNQHRSLYERRRSMSPPRGRSPPRLPTSLQQMYSYDSSSSSKRYSHPYHHQHSNSSRSRSPIPNSSIIATANNTSTTFQHYNNTTTTSPPLSTFDLQKLSSSSSRQQQQKQAHYLHSPPLL